MAKGTRICKICGKEYIYCYTLRRDDVFRWQDVACCPEHGSEYFAAILASREPDLPKIFPAPQETDEPDEPVYADEEPDDELFEEDFEDDDEE